MLELGNQRKYTLLYVTLYSTDTQIWIFITAHVDTIRQPLVSQLAIAIDSWCTSSSSLDGGKVIQGSISFHLCNIETPVTRLRTWRHAEPTMNRQTSWVHWFVCSVLSVGLSSMQVVISATDCIAEIVSNGGKDRAGARQLVQCRLKFGISEATSGVLSTKIVTSGACSWRRGTFGCPGSLSACKMMCPRCRQICLFLAFSATCWRKSLTDGKVGWSPVTQSAEFGLCLHKRRD